MRRFLVWVSWKPLLFFICQWIFPGFKVVVASGAGEGGQFSNTDYEQAGAKVVTQDESFAADLVLKASWFETYCTVLYVEPVFFRRVSEVIWVQAEVKWARVSCHRIVG